MSGEAVKLPDGGDFSFWDDATEYSRVYHVAAEHPSASDDNDGTVERPLASISAAAERAAPTEKVVVHDGVYRECVRPARGGEGAEAMIAYEAADGERPIIKASEVWTGPFSPSTGWRIGNLPEGATIWTGELPGDWFGGYNPFAMVNMPAAYTNYGWDWRRDETHRLQLRRGMVFADGEPLKQVFRYHELARTDGAFWVEEPGLRLHFRLPGDADADSAVLEVSVREQCFAPSAENVGYIRVSGLTFEHAADGVPVPQRATVSTARGHHWIVEDCTIRDANACGIDIGRVHWHAAPVDPCGGHILRRNHIHDCGVCGIAGVCDVDGSLIEDNVVEHIGGRNIERILESAGLKFHHATDVLIRRNIFRHMHHASALWLDVGNRNCRITRNVFADVLTLLGACYIECTRDLNLVDGNIIWDVRNDDPRPVPPEHVMHGGVGFDADSGENIVVAHNLLGRVRDNYAASFHLQQGKRVAGGRTGLCRRNKLLNNLFADGGKQALFARSADNFSDGNLFASAGRRPTLCVLDEGDGGPLDLAAWREYLGWDINGEDANVQADFDCDTLELMLRIDRERPSPVEVPELHDAADYPAVGPLSAEQWEALRKNGKVRVL
ncbi:MAG: right-handed parallel beta-helix repeat-containing protein [Phycisphaerae bacterium]